MDRRFQYPLLLKAVFFLCLLSSCASCKKAPETVQIDQQPFNFFVAGHVYGNRAHADTSIGMYPPFKRELELLAGDGEMELGVLTGDFVEQPEAAYYEQLETDLGVLDFPVRFALGNHDTKWQAGTTLAGEFDERCGARYGKWRHKRSLFFFLDSNQDHWRIEGRQMEMVERELADLEDIDQIFLFTHNILWWDPDSTGLHHAATPNSTWNRHPEVLFWDGLVPVLEETQRPVWIFAGDTGAHCNGRETSYWSEGNLHLVSNGMGCDGRSSYLRVRVDGGVSVELVGLDGAEPGSLEDWRY